jgi:hypothetical protein
MALGLASGRGVYRLGKWFADSAKDCLAYTCLGRIFILPLETLHEVQFYIEIYLQKSPL